MRLLRTGAALFLLVAADSFVHARPPTLSGQQSMQISGVVHEAKPTTDVMASGVRVEVAGGELAGRVVTTGSDGRFTLPPVTAAGFELEFTKAGYQATRRRIDDLSRDTQIDVAMMPEKLDVEVKRSGANDCVDLPAPPEGVPGLREYARVAVHHDGEILVIAAHLPFFSNEGYVYRLTPSGWVKNEFDYILLRMPVPVRGGFVYSITFGGDKDLCGAWSVEATHPS